MTTAQDGGKVVSLTTYQLKGKAVPLQARSGPEGSRKLRFPDFMTTAQDGGKVVSLTTCQLKGKVVPLQAWSGPEVPGR